MLQILWKLSVFLSSVLWRSLWNLMFNALISFLVFLLHTYVMFPHYRVLFYVFLNLDIRGILLEAFRINFYVLTIDIFVLIHSVYTVV